MSKQQLTRVYINKFIKNQNYNNHVFSGITITAMSFIGFKHLVQQRQMLGGIPGGRKFGNENKIHRINSLGVIKIS